MRAVVVGRFGELPLLREVPTPTCPPDGAVVRVGACGVCRSDWHGWQGHDQTMVAPYVPGHEWAGTVVEVGAEVQRWRGGERVTAPFVQACGHCQPCIEGAHQVCRDQRQPGFTHDGAFAELVVAHRADVNLVELPDDLDFVTAAGLGCRFATAYGAVAGHGGVQPGWWVAVHGCGGVGLSAVMILVALGARVIAVDRSRAALELARELGADKTLDVSSLGAVDDPVAADGSAGEGVDHGATGSGNALAIGAAVRDLTNGGAHVSLDAYGSAEVCRASLASLRPRGRHVQVGLLVGADASAPLPLDQVLADELTIVGSHGLAAHEYPAMLDLVRTGNLPLDRLVGETIRLDDACAALVAMGELGTRGGMRVISLGGTTAPERRP